MKFTEEVEKLQKKYPNSIILVKNGIFFVAIGKDAIILNKELALKVTCMKEGLCKVGFLVKNVDNYIKKLQDKEISFMLYTIDKATNNIDLIYENKAKDMIEERQCLDCKNCKQKKESDDEILERLKNIKQ
ncbi:MAG: hypothetical protein J6J60_08395 [Clostridia bacterium]|nr:hypothetical protein [Clostridia bacterium]